MKKLILLVMIVAFMVACFSGQSQAASVISGVTFTESPDKVHITGLVVALDFNLRDANLFTTWTQVIAPSMVASGDYWDFELVDTGVQVKELDANTNWITASWEFSHKKDPHDGSIEPSQPSSWFSTWTEVNKTTGVQVDTATILTAYANHPDSDSGDHYDFLWPTGEKIAEEITLENFGNSTWTINDANATHTPEPTTMAMFGLGALGMAIKRKKIKLFRR